MSQEQNEISNEAVCNCIQRLQAVISSQDTRTISSECQELIKGVSVANEWYKQRFESSCSDARTILACVSSALDLIVQVFTFCKDADVNHHWVFAEHNNHFGSIFKANMNALKLCFEQLDRVCVSEDSVNLDVLVHLRDLCRVVLHFDTTLLVHAWKHTCKLLQKHKAALSGSVSDCLHLHEFVDELCCTVESIFSKVILASGGAVQEFQRLVKGCKQLLACLMMLLRDIDDGSGDTTSCYKLLLTMISSVPPAIGAHPIQDGPLQTIRSSLLCVSDPLLTILLERRGFAKQVLNRELVEKGQYYAWCSCLMKILVLFNRIPSGIQEYDYLESESSEEGCTRQCAVLDSVFDSVRLCHVELSLPLSMHTMTSSTASSPVPLYQYVCTTLCAFAVQLPSRYFHKLESVLMRNLTCEEPHSSLLASDVLSFILRWGSADLCKEFAFLLAKIVLHLPLCTVLYHRIFMLASRAVTFMANDDKNHFIHEFNPASPDNLKLWSKLSLQQFGLSQLKQVCNTLIVLCSKCIEQVLSHNAAAYQTLYYALEAMHHVYSIPKYNEVVLQDHCRKGITLLLQLWDWSLLIADLGSSLVAQLVVCSMIRATAKVVDLLASHDIIKVLSYTCHFAHSTPASVCLPVAIGDMLEACGGVSIKEGENLQNQFFSHVINIFHCLLTTDHWLVRERTLEAFSSFAKCTPYDDLGQMCIPRELDGFVAAYLTKNIHHDSYSENDVKIGAVVERLRMRFEAVEKREASLSQEEQHEDVNDAVVDLTGEDQFTSAMDTTQSKKCESTNQLSICNKDSIQMMEEGWLLLKEQSSWDCSVVARLRSLHTDIGRQLETQEDILL